MNNIQELIVQLRGLSAKPEGEVAHHAPLLDQAAQALEQQHSDITDLKSQNADAFKAGMKAEAYLASTPPGEDG